MTVEKNTPISITNDVFTNRTNATLYVPAGSKASYEAADYWKDFKNIITFGSEVVANNLTRAYGEANPKLTYTVNGDEISGMPVLTCEATETSPVGTYDILISKGTVSNSHVSFKKGILTINPKGVSSPTIILSKSSYIYDGTAKEPTVTVMDDETVIPASEYTISYSNNTNVGTATVTITDKEGGNYIVSGSTTFTIHGMELPADELFSGSNLWAGYVAQEDLRPGTGLKVYAITKLGTTTATASQIDYMPQGVPVLLKRADKTVSSYEVTLGTGIAPTTNLLRVFNADRNVSNREGFILFNDEFVLVNEGVLPAGRMFLPANNLQLSRGMTRTVVIDDDDATGIEDLEESPAEEEPYNVYDLSGRKVANQVTSLDGLPHGIYIVNGKKMLKR